NASTTVPVEPAAADHLVFGVQPTSTPAGVAISPAVTVQVLDRYGNLATTDSSDKGTLSGAGGAGGVSTASTTAATVNGGIATFSNLVLTSPGSYTLAAAANGLTSTTSTSFTVGAVTPDHLAFSVPPSTTAVGSPISPAVKVQVLDQFGNVVTSD